jgi:PIN domain nuclease of toxin-antitoxin system
VEQPEIVVLDTHKWIYWVHGDKRLPSREALRLDAMTSGIVVPAICQIEVAQLHFRGRIDLGVPIGDWLRWASNYQGVEIYPLTLEVAALAYSLPNSFHSDPADRMIVATARLLNADLLTDYGLIRRYEGVRTP